jgi:hypothetical protein
MPEYHLYAITDVERQYLGPRKMIQCANDDAAIKAAETWAKEHEVEIEVWEKVRSLHDCRVSAGARVACGVQHFERSR